MTGMLALVGGREHHPGCEEIDRAVIASCGTRRPLVAVIPLASSHRTQARTVGRAVGWWGALGATTVVVNGHDVASTPAIEAADVIVLTGGVPDRLHRRLVATSLAARVLARWRMGAALVGSSSGAMVMAGWRQTVRPPFSVAPALGVLPGVAIAPHHDLAVPRAVARWRAITHPHVTILGIDEATAVVGFDSDLRVLGAGRVTVRRGTWQRTHVPGDRLSMRHLVANAPDRAPAIA